MRFLIDQNLPARLVNLIVGLGWRADHVGALGMANASDRDIWSLAEAMEATVVSKDNDFVERARCSEGAKLLWLKVGNAPNRALYDLIRAQLPDAVTRFEKGERIIELTD